MLPKVKNISLGQRAVIDRLGSDGHDTAKAEALFRQFQQIQAMHIAHRTGFAGNSTRSKVTLRSAR